MIKPLTFRVLIKPDTLEEDPAFKRAKAAGLVFADHPDTRLEEAKMDSGTVVAIGPTAFMAYAREAGQEYEPDSWLKIGDRVGFAKYAGKTVVENGTKFIIMADEDINCVLIKE